MKAAFLAGRVLFGGYFLFSGLRHFLELGSMAAYADSAGVPLPTTAVVLSGLLIVVGGASLILGLFPRVGAGLIALFLLGVTPVMHAFWAVEDAQAQAVQMTNFLKNVALLGASLIMTMVPRPWPVSVEGPVAKARRPVGGAAGERGPVGGATGERGPA